jgi:cephalosporin-C deacetylase-like acetyl esterase
VREYARTPADLGLRFEDLWIDVAHESGNGTQRLHAWWVPAAKRDAPAILYLHGVRWSLGNNLTRIARWSELGFAVLAIDYRGFGRSDGDLPSEVRSTPTRALPGPSSSGASAAATAASSTATRSAPPWRSTSPRAWTAQLASSPKRASLRSPTSSPRPMERWRCW